MTDYLSGDGIGLVINKFLLFILALIIIIEIVYVFSPLQWKKQIELLDRKDKNEYYFYKPNDYSYSFKISIAAILVSSILYFLCEPQLSRDISMFSLIMISTALLTINHLIQSNKEKRDLREKMKNMIKSHAKSTSIIKEMKNMKIEEVIT